ncbi:MAG: AzlC family ABC transporter permease [Lentilactobacillus hilgardii]|uniref:AzlC family ABC transporter permease n=1 Tax=Lactobacillaceae TaxID=33958 RepID=UPI00345EC76A
MNNINIENSSKSNMGFGDGVRSALPTVLGFISIGAAFGIIASSEGFSIWQIFLLSAVLYAGSAQFVILSMMLQHSSITSIVLMVFLVNFRMFLQSLTVAKHFQEQSIISKVFMGSLITDESFGIFSLNTVSKNKITISWMHGLNVASWFAWWLSSIVFAILGQKISNPKNFGLDFALVAMFAGLWLLTADSFFRNPVEHKLKLVITILFTIIVLVASSVLFNKVIAVLLASIMGSLVITFFSVEGRD